MKTRHLFAMFIQLVVLQACSSGYMSHTISSPGLQKKGDLSLSGQIGSAGLSFQSAIAPAKHLGIMFNASLFQQGDFIFDSDRESGNMLEFGAGYFKQQNKHMYWSTYAGIGSGSYYHSHKDPGEARYYGSVNTLQFFVQPSAGLRYRHIEGDLTLRLSAMRIKGSSRDITINRFYPLIDPALTLRVGGKIKFVAQFGTSFYLNQSSFVTPFGSLGLQVRVGPK